MQAKTRRKIAFFDIDGTVFRSSLLIELVEGLITAGIFPRESSQAYEKEYIAWRNREGTYEAYIKAVVSVFLLHIKGVHYGELADIGKLAVAAHGNHVYRYTRNLIAHLKRDNYFLVAISQSPKTILDEFCKAYGFDKVYGRIYEIGPQDKFTGEMIDGELLENKALIIERVLEKEFVTNEDSVGVGDTGGDISLLESVMTPICFNPNKELFEYAKKKDWKIVVERKDVIYEL
jgi:HAD superfamily phosphoserine phosphatase-like hydrolase